MLGPVNFGKPIHGAAANAVKSMGLPNPKPLASTWIGLVTVLITGLIAVAAPGIWRRLPIIFGAIGGYLLYLCFRVDAMFLIAPVAIILVAENLGHIKAIGAMTGRSLDRFLVREPTKGSVDCVHQFRRPLLSSQDRPSQAPLRSRHPTLWHRRLRGAAATDPDTPARSAAGDRRPAAASQRLVLLVTKFETVYFLSLTTARCSNWGYLHPDRGTGMDGGSSEGSEARFAAYVEALGVVLGHADRQQPMHDYCLGLLMPIDRKSVEPMAAVTAPGQVAAEASILASFCW